jgi:hypothetical protein
LVDIGVFDLRSVLVSVEVIEIEGLVARWMPLKRNPGFQLRFARGLQNGGQHLYRKTETGG